MKIEFGAISRRMLTVPSTFVRKQSSGFVRVLTKVGSEMDYDVVISDASSVKWAEDVQLRTSRQVFGIEELPHVCAEITTAACDQKFQDLVST
jgi:hypothetical protein